MAQRDLERQCVRPGCTRPASATLTFRYDTRQAWLSALTVEPVPATYDLCTICAGRTNPPRGWYLVDERPQPQPPSASPADEATVAVLAAVLGDSDTADVATPATIDAPAIDDALFGAVAVTVDEAEFDAQQAERGAGEPDRTDATEPAPAAPTRDDAAVAAEPRSFGREGNRREGIRPVMAALLGESVEPLVSLSPSDPLDAAARTDAAGPADADRVAPTTDVAPAESPQAVAQPVALTPVPPSQDGPAEDDPAPRLFAVPSSSAGGAASVW